MRYRLIETLAAAAITFLICSALNAGEVSGITSDQWIFVSAHEMQQSREDCAWRYVGYGYYNIVSTPADTCYYNTVVRAGFELPEGSRLTFQRLYYFNNHPTATLTTSLTEYTVDSATGANPNFLEHSRYGVTESNGFHAAQFNFPSSVVYDTYDTSVTPARQRSYGVSVDMPVLHAFIKGVAIGYVRQIAPAPASATFADVPTTHPFFNEVQQLVKSGITQGCGGNNYCPDAAVTRGQMAAFLTRALGLHWDWGTDPAP